MKSKTTFSIIIGLFIMLTGVVHEIFSNTNDLALLHTQLLTFPTALVTPQPPVKPKVPAGTTETKQAAAEFDTEKELFTTLKTLQETKRDLATQHPYESAFITPIITYKNGTYLILGQENDGTWSAFGGSSDAEDVDGTARYFTGRQRSPYITAAREFAEETSELPGTKRRQGETREQYNQRKARQAIGNLDKVTTITYKNLQNRLRQPDVRVIIQNKDYTSPSGQTRRLNTLNFLIPFNNAEIQALKRNFKANSEMRHIAIVKWDDVFEKAVRAGEDVMGKIILQDGNGTEAPRAKIKLRGIFGSNMRCLLRNKDTGYIRACE